MDNSYKVIFNEIAKKVEITAEESMEQLEDENERKAAEIMRQDFIQLQAHLLGEPLRADYAKLLVGCLITINGLESKIKQLEKAVQGYKIDLIPKLQRIMDETSDDVAAKELAKELFDKNK